MKNFCFVFDFQYDMKIEPASARTGNEKARRQNPSFTTKQQWHEDAGAAGEDVEGIIDYIRDVDTVEIAILVREAAAGVCKVSLRSKTTADVGSVSARMNGGGHKRAAGYTDHGTLDEVCDRAVQMTSALLANL